MTEERLKSMKELCAASDDDPFPQFPLWVTNEFLDEIDRLRAALDARDGAIKVAEEALDNAKVDYKISLRGGIMDEAIRRELTALCKQHGYGNVITSASGLWRVIDEVGAFTSGPCCESVRYALKLIDAALAALAAAKEGK